MTKEYEIGAGEFKVVDTTKHQDCRIKTQNIGSDIVICASRSGVGGMARGINHDQIEEFLSQFSANKNNEDIKLRLAGGNSSEESEQNLANTLRVLSTHEDIDIIANDTLGKSKYDAIKFNPLLNSLQPHIVTQAVSGVSR